MFDTLKRIFVGRPLATSEQEHQRLTKTVALAVFSSDAISSTAYATEEILFVTAVGAATSLALGLDHLVPIAIGGRAAARDRRHVVPPDDLRVPQGRRRVHRQPREPRRAAVARRGGVDPRRLHPHRRGVGLGRRRRHHLDPAVPRQRGRTPCRRRARAHPVDQPGQPARHQGVGPHLRDPDVRLHRRRRRADHVRADEELLRLVRRHRARCRSIPSQAEVLRETGGTLGLFLILKGFSSGAVALTGIEAISDGVPAFRRPEAEERGDDARVDGHDPRHAVPRRLGARDAPAPVPEPRRHRVRADGGAGVRRRRRRSGSCRS